jgi:hypothetical protein
LPPTERHISSHRVPEVACTPSDQNSGQL